MGQEARSRSSRAVRESGQRDDGGSAVAEDVYRPGGVIIVADVLSVPLQVGGIDGSRNGNRRG